MRTFFSYFFGVLIATTALLIIPVERLFDNMTDTQKLILNIKTSGMYEQLTGLTVQKLLDQKSLQNIRKTTLMPSSEEMKKVVQNVFPEEWFLNNVGAVHRDLIDLMADPSANSRDFVGIMVTDRKNMLAEELAILMERKISELPECTSQDLLNMRRRPGAIKSSDSNLMNLDLTCKPSEPLRRAILKTVRMNLDKAIAALPDSLSLLKPDLADKKGLQLEGLKSAFIFSQSFAAAGYGLLFFMLAVVILLNIKNVGSLLHRLGFPFVLTSVLMAIPFFILINGMDIIFKETAMRFNYSEASDSVSLEAARLIIAFIRSTTEHYAWNMLYLCGVLFGMGVFLFVTSRFVKLEPLSPLDQRHETNL